MSTDPRLLALKEAVSPEKRLGSIALAAGLSALVLGCYAAVPTVRALFITRGPAPKPVPEATLEQRRAAFVATLKTAGEHVATRAPFGQIRVNVERRPPRPTTPTRYGGPQLVGIAGGAVWFADGKRLQPGEESGGIQVISVDAPWGARVRWSGAEFAVSLFDRNPVNLSQPLSAFTTPGPMTFSPGPASSSGNTGPIPGMSALARPGDQPPPGGPQGGPAGPGGPQQFQFQPGQFGRGPFGGGGPSGGGGPNGGGGANNPGGAQGAPGAAPAGSGTVETRTLVIPPGNAEPIVVPAQGGPAPAPEAPAKADPSKDHEKGTK